MSHILHIDSSPRGERSHSRRLAAEFMKAWREVHPGDTVTYRDVGHNPIPPVDERWIAAAFTAPAERTAQMKTDLAASDALVDEFLSADRCVLSVPMHNFGVPSGLKAYVDQIVRVGRTFTPEWQGLALGKRLLVVTARGGAYMPGTPFAPFDQQEPYLRTVFGFMGITDLTFVHAQGINLGDDLRQKGLASARAELARLASTW